MHDWVLFLQQANLQKADAHLRQKLGFNDPEHHSGLPYKELITYRLDSPRPGFNFLHPKYFLQPFFNNSGRGFGRNSDNRFFDCFRFLVLWKIGNSSVQFRLHPGSSKSFE